MSAILYGQHPFSCQTHTRRADTKQYTYRVTCQAADNDETILCRMGITDCFHPDCINCNRQFSSEILFPQLRTPSLNHLMPALSRLHVATTPDRGESGHGPKASMHVTTSQQIQAPHSTPTCRYIVPVTRGNDP
ncbi:hypothetical protein LSAT2_032226 [Lamellibrachia satsuma]|nr:hypothetical protein LSAT2_032226 [Lamellibrachia satsuma]